MNAGHGHDHDHDHDHEDSEAYDLIAQMIYEQDTLELLTVGIDIGSSTTHLLFAEVVLKRQTHELSSRFVVIERTIRWRSPIRFTPFLPDGTIDANELREFFRGCYDEAGIETGDVDSGAVILTGEAIKKKNARAIDEIFANEAGKFVCATAGHKLESILAAHGSGATALSKQRNACGLHIDVGGGTTKMALVDRGEIVDVAAFAVGGRLLAQDADGEWTRVDDSAQLAAAELGLDSTPEWASDPEARRAIAARLATIVVDRIADAPLDALGRALELTTPLDRSVTPTYVTFSGGVAEYIVGGETESHGDIARDVATEILAQLKSRVSLPIVDAGQRIRATVIGASQFTVQVSGKTVHMSDMDVLPVHNVPVIHLGADIDDEIDPAAVAESFVQSVERQDRDVSSVLALAFTWSGPPEYQRLLAMAKAVMAAAAPTGKRDQLLVLVIDGDVGQTLGRILVKELNLDAPLISIDGIGLKDLDFVDIGEFLNPPGVVPVVIKSLLFS